MRRSSVGLGAVSLVLWATAFLHGSQWTIETVDTRGDCGPFPSVALDLSGHPAISYTANGNTEVRYAERASTWTLFDQPVDTMQSFGTDQGRWTSMVIGSDGLFRLAYTYYYHDGDGNHFNIKLARRQSDDWLCETVESSGTCSHWLSMALGDGNNPEIVYEDRGDTLRHAAWDGSSWTKQTIASGSWVGKYPDIKIDSTGRSHVSYNDQGLQALRYAWSDGGGWSNQTITSIGPGAYPNTSLAVDAKGCPRVAHVKGDNSLDYSAFNGSSWEMETIENDGCLGASLALDSSGTPHLAYQKDGRLWHAFAHLGIWQKEMLDVATLVGSYPSLTIGRDDSLHIAYYDASQGVLKYAYAIPESSTLFLLGIGVLSVAAYRSRRCLR